MADEFKRHIAYKMKVGDILSGKQVFDEERFRSLESEEKNIVRVNIIANITEKFIQDDEKKFASMTLDDASGQIKLKTFGEDIYKFEKFAQGDTILAIGLLKSWNNELYILPEIIKKKDSQYLLIRKLEIESEKPKQMEKSELIEIRDKIVSIIKREEQNGGADVEKITAELKSSSPVINQEIKKLLEEGMIYEPRPGKVRYLG